MVQIAWSAPPTFTTGQTITAAFLNALRDNLNETAPAKATITSSPTHFVGNGVNQIAQRTIQHQLVDVNETTTSNTFTDLTTTGPSLTITTGTAALVFLSAQVSNSTVDKWAVAAIDHSAWPADDRNSVTAQPSSAGAPTRAGITLLTTGLTAGPNFYTVKYRCESGSTGSFHRRRLTVMGL